jgi:hypothetical protein
MGIATRAVLRVNDLNECIEACISIIFLVEVEARPPTLAAGGYAGGGSFLCLLGFLRGCVSRWSGLSTLAIMAVATRV